MPTFQTVTDTVLANEAGQTQTGTLEFESGADGVNSLNITGITGLPNDWTTSAMNNASVNIFSPDGTHVFTVTLNTDGTYTVDQLATGPERPIREHGFADHQLAAGQLRLRHCIGNGAAQQPAGTVQRQGIERSERQP